MQDATLARIASDLRRVGERVEKYADTVKRPGHLAVSIDHLEVQAGRLLVEAIDKGAFPESQAKRNQGWWDSTRVLV